MRLTGDDRLSGADGIILINPMDFAAFLKTVQPEDWEKMATEKWTVKHVVAHLVGWAAGDPKAIRDAWETKTPPWWMRHNEDDAFNERNVSLFHDWSPDELIAKWEKCQQAIRDEIEIIGEQNIQKHPELFRWLLDAEKVGGDNQHVLHHRKQIEKAIAR